MTKPLKHHLKAATSRHAQLMERRRKLAAQRQAEHDAAATIAQAAAAAAADQLHQLAQAEPPQPDTGVA